VRDDRAGVLLAVPRTLAAQAPGDLIEVLERFEVRRRGYARVTSLIGLRFRAPSHQRPDGVRPEMPLGEAGVVVPAPAGCGPCGEPALDVANGLKDPGAPGVGPLPEHWS
jgi:hypothetical protein